MMNKCFYVTILFLLTSCGAVNANDFYNASGIPVTGASLSSSEMRDEFSAIEDGFDVLPSLSGNGDEILTVNPGATAITSLPVDTVIDSSTSVIANNVHVAGDGSDHANVATNDIHVAGDGSDHDDVATNTAASHAEIHTVASHSDTAATGAELNSLTDGSDVDNLHKHDVLWSNIGQPVLTTISGNTAITYDCEVGGDIAVTGTVDGRDVAADGVNMDTLTDGTVVDPDGSILHKHHYLSFEDGTPAIEAVNDTVDYISIGDLVLMPNLSVSENVGISGTLTVDGVLYDPEHTVASHSDTTATGSELNSLTDGSDVDNLHKHDVMWSSIGQPVATTITGDFVVTYGCEIGEELTVVGDTVLSGTYTQTTDPLVAGQLWNDSGILTFSTGP